MINYVYLKDKEPFPELPNTCLYQIITAANGIFVHSKREGLEVCLQIGDTDTLLHGLGYLEPFIRVEPIPYKLIIKLYMDALVNYRRERIYQIKTNPWKVFVPRQFTTKASAKLVDFSESKKTIFEIHSHNTMDAFFSFIDDEDEVGFKIYGVIGNVVGQPEISFRIGVFGYRFPIAASLVASIPFFMKDKHLEEPSLWN